MDPSVRALVASLSDTHPHASCSCLRRKIAGSRLNNFSPRITCKAYKKFNVLDTASWTNGLASATLSHFDWRIASIPVLVVILITHANSAWPRSPGRDPAQKPLTIWTVWAVFQQDLSGLSGLGDFFSKKKTLKPLKSCFKKPLTSRSSLAAVFERFFT